MGTLVDRFLDLKYISQQLDLLANPKYQYAKEPLQFRLISSKLRGFLFKILILQYYIQFIRSELRISHSFTTSKLLVIYIQSCSFTISNLHTIKKVLNLGGDNGFSFLGLRVDQQDQ
jgi:hypothetical protein